MTCLLNACGLMRMNELCIELGRCPRNKTPREKRKYPQLFHQALSSRCESSQPPPLKTPCNMTKACLHSPSIKFGEDGGVGNYADTTQHSRITCTIMSHNPERILHSKYPCQDKDRITSHKSSTFILFNIQKQSRSKTNPCFVKILGAATFMLTY